MTAPSDLVAAARVRDALDAQLDDEARQRLATVVAAVAQDAAEVAARFPMVSRAVGRAALRWRAGEGEGAGIPDDPWAWTVDDAARALLVTALGDAAAAQLPELYRHGDARERRGALRALDVAEVAAVVGDVGRTLVDDALRTNDTRLVAAALGPYGARTLDDAGFRQAVLKCAFVGLDPLRIPSATDRATPELARMLADFVHERVAAGRAVPPSVWPFIERDPPAERLAAIEAELRSDVPERRAAARAALAARDAARGR